MTVHQCRTCRYAHKYAQMTFSANSCGGGEPTGKMVTVCVLRNYTQTLNHFKHRNCRLYELPPEQMTIAESCS